MFANRTTIQCLSRPHTRAEEIAMKTQIAVKGFEKVCIGILCFALSMIVLVVPAFAQGTASAALGGAVSDKNGARIKGATVTVTNKGTGQSRTVATGDNGERSEERRVGKERRSRRATEQ